MKRNFHFVLLIENVIITSKGEIFHFSTILANLVASLIYCVCKFERDFAPQNRYVPIVPSYVYDARRYTLQNDFDFILVRLTFAPLRKYTGYIHFYNAYIAYVIVGIVNAPSKKGNENGKIFRLIVAIRERLPRIFDGLIFERTRFIAVEWLVNR